MTAFVAVTATLLVQGLRQYRQDVHDSWDALGWSRESLSDEERCYKVVTVEQLQTGIPMLGSVLRPSTVIKDPWFDNPWMMAYTSMCFSMVTASFHFLSQ